MADQVVDGDQGNEITIFVFRLLVLDLLALFQVLNQAMINILGKSQACDGSGPLSGTDDMTGANTLQATSSRCPRSTPTGQ